MLFIDYYVDAFYLTGHQWSASLPGYLTTATIGSVVCIDENDADEFGNYAHYPAAAFNNSEGIATIGYFYNMETQATVRNAHIVGAIPIISKT